MIITEKSNGICPQCGNAIITPAIINIIDALEDKQGGIEPTGRKKEFCSPDCGGKYQQPRQPVWARGAVKR